MDNYTWDITENRLTDKVSGVRALQSSIDTMMTTALAGFDIYSWEFGSELLNILNEDSDYIEAKACDYISACLENDDRIDYIKDFFIDRNGDSMTISFVVVTCYGELESEVVI